MSKIIKAVDYGYRKVFTVAINHAEAEFVHADSTSHPVLNVNGCPGNVLDPANPIYFCSYNWKTEEFIFEGMDLLQDDGSTPKTNDQLEADVKARLAATTATPQAISGLVNKVL